MKQKTFFKLALLFPYILWGVCALIFLLISSHEIPEPWNFVLMPIGLYTFGIVLWFIPYTLLAIGMWIWSKNKSIQTIYKAGVLAPLFLVLLMIVEATRLSFGAGSIQEIFNSALSEALALGVFSLVFGYGCVGIVLGLYKLLQLRNIIQEETTLNNETSPAEI